ncbi:MAG: hypothetical protein D6744_17945 [Planctomycetota bacterium]|nr:MAG: hypothetical protein D6744_17945 [Planctomycetota bacterium]
MAGFEQANHAQAATAAAESVSGAIVLAIVVLIVIVAMLVLLLSIDPLVVVVVMIVLALVVVFVFFVLLDAAVIVIMAITLVDVLMVTIIVAVVADPHAVGHAGRPKRAVDSRRRDSSDSVIHLRKMSANRLHAHAIRSGLWAVFANAEVLRRRPRVLIDNHRTRIE